MAVAAVDSIILHVVLVTEHDRLRPWYPDERHPGAAVNGIAQCDGARHQRDHPEKSYPEDSIRAAAK